jgi:CRP-like cAMP-binding protein
MAYAVPVLASSTLARRLEPAKSNRFLAALPPDDLAHLAAHLRSVPLEQGTVLQEAGEDIRYVYFPHSAMVSLVLMMQSGVSVETASIGRSGVVGLTAGLGASHAQARAVVQLPGTAARISFHDLQAAAGESAAIRDLVLRANDLLVAQIQQSVACCALHTLEARLCRWLLQAHDSVDGDALPLTQEMLGQVLGVRRTSVTIAARMLQSAGVIRYRRGLMQIVERAALEHGTCECYAALQQSIDRAFEPRPAFTLSPTRFERPAQTEPRVPFR